MTYESWYTKFLTLYRDEIAEKTRESYERCYTAYIAPTLATVELEDITPDDLQAVINIAKRKAGTRQAQIVYAQLHGCLSRAARSRHIPYNPADCIDKPKHEKEPGRSLNRRDMAALAPYIKSDIGFSLAAYAGLRRGEILGLQRRDVDLLAGTITVERQRLRVKGRIITAAPKSDAGKRIVPISRDLFPVIRQTCHLLTPNALVYPFAPETFDRRWKRVQEMAEIEKPYRLHDLRHTFATELVKQGINLKALQYLMGHSTFQLTVDTYTHMTDETAAKEYARLQAL